MYLVNNLVCSTHFGWPLLGFPPVRKDIKGVSTKEEGGNEVRAQLVKRDRLSLGGGSQKQGANEVTVEDLQKRYPNLSQAEIKARLDDINSLYSEKKK